MNTIELSLFSHYKQQNEMGRRPGGGVQGKDRKEGRDGMMAVMMQGRKRGGENNNDAEKTLGAGDGEGKTSEKREAVGGAENERRWGKN